MTRDVLDHLRDVARYHTGKDLVERMQRTEAVCEQMRDALSQAVQEIETLRAKLQEVRKAVVE